MRRRSELLYNHASKAGNRADVWKHFSLLTAAHIILKRGNFSKPFRYMETHCGLPLYFLRSGGDWERGIGAIRRPSPDLLKHPYFQTMRALGGGILFYPSSWLQLATFLSIDGIPFEMHLRDASPEVSIAMERMGVELQKGEGAISFREEDGFHALERDYFWNLVLVDPPFWPDYDSDMRRCSEALEHLRRKARTFLVWYPLVGEKAKIWHLGTKETLLEISWDEGQAKSMWGCGIMLGGLEHWELESVLPSLEELAKEMDARLRR